tara:strand:- start:193 stop:576 length:384 start_codon:yes stop_codon:yes gene_type:complete
MSFKADLNKFTKKTNRITEQVFKGTVISLFSKVVLRTPVDTGRLSQSWRPTLNKPSQSLSSSGSKGIEAVVAKAKVGDSIFLVNNLPYAQKIESGSSKQAPAGMVAITVAEYKKIINENVIKAKGGV